MRVEPVSGDRLFDVHIQVAAQGVGLFLGRDGLLQQLDRRLGVTLQRTGFGQTDTGIGRACALDLAARYSLSHWDSMLLGACLEANIETLYTEDMGAPTSYDNVRLVNPFR